MDQNKTEKCAIGLISGPCREAYWEELNDTLKIHRLREVVKEMQRQLAYITKTANDAEVVAREHEHGKDGKVLMPVDSFNQEKSEGIRRRDEKWF